MKKLSKDEMKSITGGFVDGCTAKATCSDGTSVSITGTGTGSNCSGIDYVNTTDGKGQACFHPENGNSECQTCKN